MKKKKILFAAVDIGYRIEHYTKFINKHFSNQLEAESFSKYVLPKLHYKTNYTYTCPIDKTHPIILYLYCFGFFIFSLFRYDIFHFISGETLLTRKLRRFELMIYKLFGKRVVMHFVGSDIRNPEYIYWKEENIHQFLLGNDDFPKTLPWQNKMIKDVQKYADYILVSTPDLKNIIPQAEYYPVMLDLEKYLQELNEIQEVKKETGEIVILHSPSNEKARLKGTIYINAVLKIIAANSKHKIKLVLPAEDKKEKPSNYSATRYELFKYYKEADIIIDQLIIGWYGLLSVEALAAEKQVICYIDEHLNHFIFPDCPIEIANINSLENILTKCIENVVNKNTLYLTKQIEWVKKYHTIENNNAALLRAWGI